jgi:hypothetical protein
MLIIQRRSKPSAEVSDAPFVIPSLFDLASPVDPLTQLELSFSIQEVLVKYLPSEVSAQELVDVYYRVGLHYLVTHLPVKRNRYREGDPSRLLPLSAHRCTLLTVLLIIQSFGWFTNIVPFRSFHAKYVDPCYRSITAPEAQPVAILFLILALGAVMNMNRANATDAMIQSFVTAARLSLRLDSSHSVNLVQIFYLYVTFIMNGRRDSGGGEAGWPFLRAGMAVAEAIGLHRDPAQWNLPAEHAEERRIVFWEIHGYDVLQSLALGRGQCIADASIDCGFPDGVDDSGFSCKAYALTRIWSKILERQIRISPSPYSEVVDIDESLNEFERSLPSHFSPSATPSLLDFTNPIRKRLVQRRLMLLLYLTEARMILHRGWFVHALREYPNEPLASPQNRSFINCLEACRTLIGLVRNMMAVHDQQIKRRWHFFFHLFSACACLAACAIRAPASELAQAVITELDSGVELFRAAGREETVSFGRQSWTDG